jgi:hypothetical protein
MSYGEFKTILSQLLAHSQISAPLKGQIQISIDLTRKVFCLTIPIFKSMGELPRSIHEYVSKRQNHTFKPHTTSFKNVDGEIHLIQEISFNWGFQDSFRQHLLHFWEMAKHCHKMLKEIHDEERLKRVVPIDSELDE